jgi:hypothetical protein
MTGLMFAFYAWLAATTGLCPPAGGSADWAPGQGSSCVFAHPPPPTTEPKRPDGAPGASNIYNGF